MAVEGPNPDDFVRIQKGQEAGILLEHLGPWFEKERDRVLDRVFKQIQHGKGIDPGLALQALYSLFALEQFQVSLRREFRHGVQASERIAPFMGGSEPPEG